MARGCDYAWERPSPVALAAAGYRFACRYLSWDNTGKNLTTPEAVALHTAGLSIVLNWEYDKYAMRMGHQAGVNDAQEALRQAIALGAPEEAAIYFSADWDVQGSELDAVAEYLSGAAEVLTWYRVGVYGGYRVVSAMMDAGHCRYGWQTYAWSGGAWWGGAHIRQVANDAAFPGGPIDVDESILDSFGQWKAVQDMATEPLPHEVVNLICNGSNDGGYLPDAGGPDAGAERYNLRQVMHRLDELAADLAAVKAALATLPAPGVTVSGGQVSLTGTFTGSMSGSVTPHA